MALSINCASLTKYLSLSRINEILLALVQAIIKAKAEQCLGLFTVQRRLTHSAQLVISSILAGASSQYASQSLSEPPSHCLRPVQRTSRDQQASEIKVKRDFMNDP